MNKILAKLSKKNNDNYNSEPVTIAFLGDSVTHGCFEIYKTDSKNINTVFDWENAYSIKFQKILKQLYPSAQINIINAGISGDNAPNGLKRLERDVLHYNPDLVIVCYGLNDSCSGKDFLPEYKKALAKIFDLLNQKKISCIFMTPNMMNTYTVYDEDKFFRDLGDSLSSIQNEGRLKLFFDEAKQTAKENNIPVCDCYSKWEKMFNCGVDTTKLLSNKLNHPTREMQWLFAYSLAETLFNIED